MIINQHNELLWEFGGLPSIYQQCAWIQASNSVAAYIDLGFPFVLGGTTEIGFVKVDSSQTDIQIFGATENSGKLRYLLSAGLSWYATYNGAFVNREDWHTYWYNNIGTEIVLRYAYKNGIVITEEISPQTNTTTRTDQDTITMTNNLYLLGQNYNGKYRGNGIRRVTYFKYWDKDDTLVRDMIPCYRKSDDVIGMYDLVSKTFFTNAGTGTFTKGADVN